MTDLTRDEVRQLLDNATPGPWSVERITDYSEGHSYVIPDVARWRGFANGLSFGEDEATASLVAAAPRLATQLLTALDDNERLRRALDEAQLRSIEARNPGIDMDEVRRIRAGGPR